MAEPLADLPAPLLRQVSKTDELNTLLKLSGSIKFNDIR